MKKLLIIVACMGLTACAATVHVTKTAKGFYAQSNANEIDILRTVPDYKYTELGTVTVAGHKIDEDAKMHNAIRAKASGLGATAVIIASEGLIKDGWGNFRKWATGVAIVKNPEE